MRSLSLATLFAAISGFAVVLIAPRVLDVGEVAEFQAYWGLFFALTGCIDGLMQETTRAISAARAGEPASTGTQPRRTGLFVGLIVGVAIVVTSPAWIGLLVNNRAPMAAVLLAIGLFLYAQQAVLSGVLSGSECWPQFAWLLVIDAASRLGLTMLAWWRGWGLPAFFIITVVGTISWAIILIASRQARTAMRLSVDVEARRFLRNTGSAMLAAGASAALITGFPVFVKATTDASQAAEVAAIVMAVTLTRAPILVPLQRFQSALVVRFVNRRDAVPQALMPVIGGVLGVGVIGAAAAWLLGPWILSVLLPPAFAVPGPILALLTFAASCTGALMVTGSAVLALSQHRQYVAGWVVAVCIAFFILLVDLPLATKVVVSLLVGPAVGMGVHTVTLARAVGRAVE